MVMLLYMLYEAHAGAQCTQSSNRNAVVFPLSRIRIVATVGDVSCGLQMPYCLCSLTVYPTCSRL